jgi:N-acetylmuramoyl-L-alanine amidase
MMAYRLVECPSPNHDARDASVDMLVLHYTGMKTADEALARLTDPAAKVSAHYTIGRDGRVYRHVPEDRRAWHAGVSYWAGARNINSRSIGIELVNPGHEFGYVPFTDEQIAALIDIAQEIIARHAIAPARVVGHSDVAPARKEDPGELFPWKALAEYGIGLWPQAGVETAPQDALRQYGYGLPPDVEWTAKDTVVAFQRRFRPKKLDGLWDMECALRLASLLAQARAMS